MSLPISTPEYPLFARGFYLSKRQIPLVPETYTQLPLNETWNYYHDFLTDPDIYRQGQGFSLVHGNCFTLENREPQELSRRLYDLYISDRSEFENFLDTLVGRWCLIISKGEQDLEVFHDACGTRTVYYALSAGEASSHLEFLVRNNDFERVNPGTLHKNVPLNLDHTGYAEIFSLIPNHAVRLGGEGSKTYRYWPRQKNPATLLSHIERVEEIRDKWAKVLDQYVAAYGSIAFSLSGGEDSRLNLAMAGSSIENLRCFTYSSRAEGSTYWHKTMRKDTQIVEQILDVLPLNHSFFYREDSAAEQDRSLIQALRLASPGKHGYWLLPLYRAAFPGLKETHLRGTLFEVGKAIYHRDDDRGTLADIWRFYRQGAKEQQSPEAESAFASGIERLELAPEHLQDYLPSDIFYWEYRMGRWFSETLNESDLAFDSFIAINCRQIFNLFLAYSLDERRGCYLFNELINKELPVLNFLGKNDVRNIYEQLVETGQAPGFYRPHQRSVLELAATGAQVREEALEEAETELSFTSENFVEGASLRYRFRAQEDYPAVRISWSSDYKNPKATGKFEFRVLTDNRVVFRRDGTALAGADSVRLTEVKKGGTVDFELYALSTQPRASWEKASRVQNIVIEPEA